MHFEASDVNNGLCIPPPLIKTLAALHFLMYDLIDSTMVVAVKWQSVANTSSCEISKRATPFLRSSEDNAS
jgi:hypothetical protein